MAKGIKIEGLQDVTKEFNKRLKEISGGTKKSLVDVAMDLKQRAIDLAPIDTGELRRSAYVDVIDDTTVEIGFNQEYALVQHESLEFNHPQGGQAKFLEQPFKQNFNKYVKSISNAVRKGTE